MLLSVIVLPTLLPNHTCPSEERASVKFVVSLSGHFSMYL